MPKVCLAPIWYPLESYATSRLRAKYVAELLADLPQWEVQLDYQPEADIAILVQLCSHRTFRRIRDTRHQLVVYDICDRFFDTDSLFQTEEGPLSARSRCLELIERADVLIAPTRQLKGEISQRFSAKPCFHVPECVDYGASPQPASIKARVIHAAGNAGTRAWRLPRGAEMGRELEDRLMSGGGILVQ